MVWDPKWEEVFQQQHWGKYPSEELIRFIARNFYHVKDRGRVRVLEVGCGPGANLWYMAREGFAVYGIDGSRSAIDQATTRLDLECPDWQGELQVGDIMSLPYADASFDAVIDIEALCCNSFEDSCRIIQEIGRVIKPGGKFFSRTFATGCWGEGTGEPIGHNAWHVSEGPLANKGYARFTDRADLPDLLQGFQLEELELLSRTMSGMQHTLKEWLIVAQKQT